MLSINHLHAEVMARQKKRNAIYEEVFKRVISRIQYENTKNDNCMCTYTLPVWVFGVPLYNLTACAEYIIRRLQEHSLQVVYRPPTTLFISWKLRPAVQMPLPAPYPPSTLGEIQETRQIALNPSKNKQSLFDEIDKTFLQNDGMSASPPQAANDWRIQRNTGHSLNLDDLLRALD